MTWGSQSAEVRVQKSESRQPLIGIPHSGGPSLRSAIGHSRSAVLAVAKLVGSAAVLHAQATNLADTNAIPPLRPPKPEIPPGVWETSGLWITLLGIGVLAGLVFAVRFVCRPKPPVVREPATVAREALSGLESQPEDDSLLSQVSAIVRTYLITAFGLPPQALTHRELCDQLHAHPDVGEELSGAARELLEDLEHRRFDSQANLPQGGFVKGAMGLIDQAERSREPKPATPDAADSDA